MTGVLEVIVVVVACVVALVACGVTVWCSIVVSKVDTTVTCEYCGQRIESN